MKNRAAAAARFFLSTSKGRPLRFRAIAGQAAFSVPVTVLLRAALMMRTKDTLPVPRQRTRASHTRPAGRSKDWQGS